MPPEPAGKDACATHVAQASSLRVRGASLLPVPTEQNVECSSTNNRGTNYSRGPWRRTPDIDESSGTERLCQSLPPVCGVLYFFPRFDLLRIVEAGAVPRSLRHGASMGVAGSGRVVCSARLAGFGGSLVCRPEKESPGFRVPNPQPDNARNPHLLRSGQSFDFRSRSIFMIDAIISTLKDLMTTRGRIPRSTFWWFHILLFLVWGFIGFL